MLYKKNVKNLHAQTVLEYVLLVGIIVTVLFAMTQAIKRGAQSLIKTAADELGNQQNSDQSFDHRQGFLEFSNTASSTQNLKRVRERIGVTNYIVDSQDRMSTESKTNMGFTEVK